MYLIQEKIKVWQTLNIGLFYMFKEEKNVQWCNLESAALPLQQSCLREEFSPYEGKVRVVEIELQRLACQKADEAVVFKTREVD